MPPWGVLLRDGDHVILTSAHAPDLDVFGHAYPKQIELIYHAATDTFAYQNPSDEKKNGDNLLKQTSGAAAAD